MSRSKDPITLREIAEERLRGQKGEFDESSDQDIRRLLHELQVHQIELEMQNEELRSAQRELEVSHSRYVDLYDFAPVGYVTLDPKGLILDVNLTGAEMLGVERSGLLKRKFQTFIASDAQGLFHSFVKRVLETGTKETCELQLVKRDGAFFYARLESIAVRGDEGGFARCRTALIDVTERKGAERQIGELNRELQHRLAELETIFETVPIGLSIADDAESRHIRGNPHIERMLGLPRGSELSKSASETLAPTYRVLEDGRDLAVEELPMQRAIRGETVNGQALTVVRDDGNVVELLCNAAPLLDEEGRPCGAVGAFQDITDLKRAEAGIERYAGELRANNEELMRLNRTMVGRELRMIELKKEVNGLCKRVGDAPRYPLDFEKEEG